jgi:hypothetical protein
MATRFIRKALAPAIVLLALAPASASAWTVTIHVHGAGGVKEVINRAGDSKGQMNCFVGPSGTSESSVTDCVAGSQNGLYNSGNIVRLEPQVSQTAANRGWVFSHWTDSNAGGGRINCDPQDTSGDFSNPIYCEFQIFENLNADLWFDDTAGPQDTGITGGPANGAFTNSTSASFALSAPSDPDAHFRGAPARLSAAAATRRSTTSRRTARTRSACAPSIRRTTPTTHRPRASGRSTRSSPPSR